MSFTFFDSMANIIGFVSSVIALGAVIRIVISYQGHLPRASYERLQHALDDVEELFHEASEIARPPSPALCAEFSLIKSEALTYKLPATTPSFTVQYRHWFGGLSWRLHRLRRRLTAVHDKFVRLERPLNCSAAILEELTETCTRRETSDHCDDTNLPYRASLNHEHEESPRLIWAPESASDASNVTRSRHKAQKPRHIKRFSLTGSAQFEVTAMMVEVGFSVQSLPPADL